jgi:hypothetical protein
VFGVQWFSVQAEGEVGKLRAESESQTAAMYGSIPDVTGKVGGYQARYRLAGQWFGHAGGGVKYRIASTAGVFTDARYLFSGADGLPDAQVLWRFGVRWAFRPETNCLRLPNMSCRIRFCK